MLTKAEQYAQMANRAEKQLTSNWKEWTGFLTTASRMYKYTYTDQLMIYIQRPDATACAEYDLWNKKMRRYIKRGSKGIALLDTSGAYLKLRYVFDVADTGTRRSSKELNLWKMEPQHYPSVQAAIETAFGVSADECSMIEQIEQVSRQLASEYWVDHHLDFLNIIDNSFLEEYDELNIGVKFKAAAAVSISYTLMSRCGLEPEQYFDHEDFMPIFDFNSSSTIAALGNAVSQISAKVLREIEKSIKTYERDVERSKHDEERTELQASWGLSDSGYRADGQRQDTYWQVRPDAASISTGAPSHPVQSAGKNPEALSPSSGNRSDSPEPSGTDDAPIGRESRSNRGAESQRSNGMGGTDEQLQSTGRRDSDDGADLYLTSEDSKEEQVNEQASFFLSESDQIKFIDEAESKQLSAFSFNQNTIDHVLELAHNTDEGRKIVALEYMKGKPIEDIISTLRDVYHGGYGLIEGNLNVSVWFTEDGIHLAYGNAAAYQKKAQILSWEDAAKRIEELLKNGQYATNVELTEAPGYNRQQLARSFWYLRQDFSKEAHAQGFMPSIQDLGGGGFPDETAFLTKKLENPAFRKTLLAEYGAFREALQKNSTLLRLHYHKLERMEQHLQELDLPLQEYHTDMAQMPLIRRFITDDEIHADLSKGSGISGGKRRIYDFWQQNHTNQEKVEFLKQEHGTGGYSHALSGATYSSQDHDAKGIRYKKEGCDTVQLSWSQVASRLDSLIANDHYLTAEEKKQLDIIQAGQQLANETQGVKQPVNPFPKGIRNEDAPALEQEKSDFLTAITPEQEAATIAPSYSLWGQVDRCKMLYPGIYEVSTPGHGGVMVKDIREERLTPAVREVAQRWGSYLCYEEDCDATHCSP